VVHGRDAERTRDLASRVKGIVVLADLGDPAGVQVLADQALGVHGHIDVLVANAGHGWSGPFVEMTDEEICELVTVDLLAGMRLNWLLLPGMIERRSGGWLCGTARSDERVPPSSAMPFDVRPELRIGNPSASG
jgi:NAD(P)-dependent dehydrogenase (short-subunit alcohol dehydrogenase family)